MRAIPARVRKQLLLDMTGSAVTKRSSLKSGVAALLGSMARSLPWGAREAVFASLCERRGPFASLSDLAQQLGVETFVVPGKYGRMQSSSKDCSILASYARTGEFAERSNGLLMRFLATPEPSSYIDIGANIGMTTIPVAQYPHVACMAVEPEPINYENLVSNVARNCPHGNVQTWQLAIFKEPSSLQFEIATGNLGDHRLRLNESAGDLDEQARKVISVEAVTLDSLVGNGLRDRLAVKIDVQGAEPFVVEGGAETLARAGLVILEFWPYSMARLGADSGIVLDFLERHFASISIAVGETGTLSEPKSAAEAVRELREFAATKAGDVWSYLDIVATKSDALSRAIR